MASIPRVQSSRSCAGSAALRCDRSNAWTVAARWCPRHGMGIARLALRTGRASTGGILGLRWSDVDLDRVTVRITRAVTYAGAQVHVGDPKTSAGNREFSLRGFVAALLKRGRVEHKRRRLLLGEDWIDNDLVVDRGDGDYWIPPSFSTAWRRYHKDHGLPHVSLRWDEARVCDAHARCGGS
jgi:integrase